MGNERMFSFDIVNDDKFLSMPASAQALYFHLGMRTGEYDFVSNPEEIVRKVNCSIDDLETLLRMGYILSFDGEIMVEMGGGERVKMGGTKYLKMPTDFFENEAIDFLLSQKQGTKYVTLYIMLCLKSLNTNGKLVCQVGEMLIPYNAEWIQKDCKYFSKKYDKKRIGVV